MDYCFNMPWGLVALAFIFGVVLTSGIVSWVWYTRGIRRYKERERMVQVITERGLEPTFGEKNHGG